MNLTNEIDEEVQNAEQERSDNAAGDEDSNGDASDP
jgi:hypothetical protein